MPNLKGAESLARTTAIIMMAMGVLGLIAFSSPAFGDGVNDPFVPPMDPTTPDNASGGDDSLATVYADGSTIDSPSGSLIETLIELSLILI